MKPAMTDKMKAEIKAFKTAQVRVKEAVDAEETARVVSALMAAETAALRGVEDEVERQALITITIEEFKNVAGKVDALNALIGRKMAAVMGRPDLPDDWRYYRHSDDVLRQYIADATVDDDVDESAGDEP